MTRRDRDRADIHSFKSRGTTSRWLDPRGDFQTAFSSLERDAALRMEYEERVLGMSMQLYLEPFAEIKEIAHGLGCEAPDYPHGERLSTDILVDVHRPRGNHRIAVHVKYEVDLGKPRNQEKREIERRFWERRGVEFRVETEQTLPADYRHNLQHAFTCAGALETLEIAPDLPTVRQDLARLLSLNPHASLGEITDQVDFDRSLPSGSTMTVLWAALWEGRFAADLTKPIRPSSRALVLWSIDTR